MATDKGICPNCKQEITEYGVIKIDGEMIGYPFDCLCGFKGTEWYNTEFNETTKNE